jgi:hypothetical protein
VTDERPDWERLLAAERHLQALLPGAVLVGGTAASLHARHRVSLDGDHVLRDLRERFDDFLATARLEGIPTGIRQLRRTAPLETEVVEGLRIPTLAEMARIKAWLLATRYTVRDYLDTVVLLERLGEEGVRRALSGFDALYRQSNGSSPLAEVVERLAQATPLDAPQVDLGTYRELVAPWNDRSHLVARGRHWARVLAPMVLSGESP